MILGAICKIDHQAPDLTWGPGVRPRFDPERGQVSAIFEKVLEFWRHHMAPVNLGMVVDASGDSARPKAIQRAVDGGVGRRPSTRPALVTC